MRLHRESITLRRETASGWQVEVYEELAQSDELNQRCPA